MALTQTRMLMKGVVGVLRGWPGVWVVITAMCITITAYTLCLAFSPSLSYTHTYRWWLSSCFHFSSCCDSFWASTFLPPSLHIPASFSLCFKNIILKSAGRTVFNLKPHRAQQSVKHTLSMASLLQGLCYKNMFGIIKDSLACDAFWTPPDDFPENSCDRLMKSSPLQSLHKLKNGDCLTSIVSCCMFRDRQLNKRHELIAQQTKWIIFKVHFR